MHIKAESNCAAEQWHRRIFRRIISIAEIENEVGQAFVSDCVNFVNSREINFVRVKMEATLTEAIQKYCEQRRHQLNAIDDTRFAGGDTMKNELRAHRAADIFPILNEWVGTLTRVTNDLIETIKDVERTISTEDERMANTSGEHQHQSSDKSKQGVCEPMMRNKSKNKSLTKILGNKHSICRSSSAAQLLSDENDAGDGAMATAATATATTTNKDVNSMGFCTNLLKRIFTKGKCEEGVVRPDEGCGNGRINNIEFVYVDKSVCCMSTITNEKLTNTTALTNAESVYADFKANCTDRMQTLHNVTTALQTSLQQQEQLSSQQLEDIERLRAQIKRLKKYRRSNRMLEANVKSICAENAHLLVEAKKIEKQLRLLRKRQPLDTATNTEHES